MTFDLFTRAKELVMMLHFNACHGKKRKDKADIKLITFVPGCVVGPGVG